MECTRNKITNSLDQARRFLERQLQYRYLSCLLKAKGIRKMHFCKKVKILYISVYLDLHIAELNTPSKIIAFHASNNAQHCNTKI